MITSNRNIERFVADETISEGNCSSIKLAEEWTSVALDIGDLETKQQRCDTFDAPANLKDTPLDPAPPGSSAASGNKYPPDSRLLFNSTLPQSRCIDSNSGQFVTEPQDDGYPPPASVQEIQDIDPSVAVDPDDRQFLVERLVRKRVRHYHNKPLKRRSNVLWLWAGKFLKPIGATRKSSKPRWDAVAVRYWSSGRVKCW